MQDDPLAERLARAGASGRGRSPTRSWPNTGPVISDSGVRPARAALGRARASGPVRGVEVRRVGVLAPVARQRRPLFRGRHAAAPGVALSSRSAPSSGGCGRLGPPSARRPRAASSPWPRARRPRSRRGGPGQGQRCSPPALSMPRSGMTRSTPRSVITTGGPPDRGAEVHLSTNVRGDWRIITIISPASAAISGAPPPPGQTHLRLLVFADHRAVQVAAAVDLGGAQEAHVDPAALEPVVEDLGHGDHRVGGLGQLAVADRQRQRGGFEPMVPDS